MREALRETRYWGLLWVSERIGHLPSHRLRDRFYRKVLGLKLPGNSIVYWRARFFKPDGIRIGERTIIGEGAFLDGRFGLDIGSDVDIASEVRIWTAQHDTSSATFAVVGAPVHIGAWAFIGSRVTILPGVSIGEGTVVGAGAVVAKDLPAWTICVGVPARPVRARPRVRYELDTRRRALFQ